METLGWIVLYGVGYVLAYLMISYEVKKYMRLTRKRKSVILLFSLLSWIMVAAWLLDEATTRKPAKW